MDRTITKPVSYSSEMNNNFLQATVNSFTESVKPQLGKSFSSKYHVFKIEVGLICTHI